MPHFFRDGKKDIYLYAFLSLLSIGLFVKYPAQAEEMQNPIPELKGLGITILWAGPDDLKAVALTFDDGPSPGKTPALLKLLKEQNIPATFFLVGERVAAHPEIVEQMALDGHEIGNHTWSHKKLTSLGMGEIRNELVKCQDAIEKASGLRPTLFRPPYGAASLSTLSILARHSLTAVFWSIDPQDWKAKSEQSIKNSVKDNLHPGAIILFHEHTDHTVDVLPLVISEIRNQGYQFLRVSELFNLTPSTAVVVKAGELPQLLEESNIPQEVTGPVYEYPPDSLADGSPREIVSILADADSSDKNPLESNHALVSVADPLLEQNGTPPLNRPQQIPPTNTIPPPTPTETPEPTLSKSPTSTLFPTWTSIPLAAPLPSPTITAIPPSTTATPTTPPATATLPPPSPTNTEVALPSVTPSLTETLVPTSSPSLVPTVTQTQVPSLTPTHSPTRTTMPTNTPTPTPTHSMTRSHTPTRSHTHTKSPTATRIPPSLTPTRMLPVQASPTPQPTLPAAPLGRVRRLTPVDHFTHKLPTGESQPTSNQEQAPANKPKVYRSGNVPRP